MINTRELLASGCATSATYEVDRRQFVVIAAGGGRNGPLILPGCVGIEGRQNSDPVSATNPGNQHDASKGASQAIMTSSLWVRMWGIAAYVLTKAGRDGAHAQGPSWYDTAKTPRWGKQPIFTRQANQQFMH